MPEAGGLFGGGDDVGEQDGAGAHVSFGGLTVAGQELLDLIEHAIGIEEPQGVIAW